MVRLAEAFEGRREDRLGVDRLLHRRRLWRGRPIRVAPARRPGRAGSGATRRRPGGAVAGGTAGTTAVGTTGAIASGTAGTIASGAGRSPESQARSRAMTVGRVRRDGAGGSGGGSRDGSGFRDPVRLGWGPPTRPPWGRSRPQPPRQPTRIRPNPACAQHHTRPPSRRLEPHRAAYTIALPGNGGFRLEPRNLDFAQRPQMAGQR